MLTAILHGVVQGVIAGLEFAEQNKRKRLTAFVVDDTSKIEQIRANPALLDSADWDAVNFVLKNDNNALFDDEIALMCLRAYNKTLERGFRLTAADIDEVFFVLDGIGSLIAEHHRRDFSDLSFLEYDLRRIFPKLSDVWIQRMLSPAEEKPQSTRFTTQLIGNGMIQVITEPIDAAVRTFRANRPIPRMECTPSGRRAVQKEKEADSFGKTTIEEIFRGTWAENEFKGVHAFTSLTLEDMVQIPPEEIVAMIEAARWEQDAQGCTHD